MFSNFTVPTYSMLYQRYLLAESVTRVPEKGEIFCINIPSVRPAAVSSPVTFSFFQSVVIGVF